MLMLVLFLGRINHKLNVSSSGFQFGEIENYIENHLLNKHLDTFFFILQKTLDVTYEKILSESIL